MTRQHEPDLLAHCPRCGYSLEGLPVAHTCPECGRKFDRRWRVYGRSRSRWGRRQVLWTSVIIVYTAYATAVVVHNPQMSHARAAALVTLFVGFAFLAWSSFRRPRGFLAITEAGVIINDGRGTERTFAWDAINACYLHWSAHDFVIISQHKPYNVFVDDLFYGGRAEARRCAAEIRERVGKRR